MKRITYLLLFMACSTVRAQQPWTVEQCMQYAVGHNHDVRLLHLTIDDYKAEKTSAVGAFLPAVEGSVGAQYNFGRAINPETNTYTNVSTFSNSYGLGASLPVFEGFRRYNNLLAAKANLLMGKSRIEAQKDATAQRVLETYVLALYHKGCIDIAAQKRTESEMLLRQTQVMAEVGQKGEADVALMRATYAADDFELTRQQGLYDQTMLTLKQLMNFPIGDTLRITTFDDVTADLSAADATALYEQARHYNPDIRGAEYSLLSARYAYRSVRGALLPTLSVGAGISTSFFKQLHAPHSASFKDQFRNNAGQYLYATLSIPLFNRLTTLANVRRQRNNVRRAEEELAYRHSELQRLIHETITDRENSRKETEKMRAKVESDSIASRLTVRKYEEGLASAVEVQTQAVALLQSKAQLLQCQLTQLYKTRMLNYYKGIPLWTE